MGDDDTHPDRDRPNAQAQGDGVPKAAADGRLPGAPDDVRDTDDEAEAITVRYVFLTTFICVCAASAGHVVLWVAYSSGWQKDRFDAGQPLLVPWEAVVGISLCIVALVAFGGFYAASRRARVAIASSFLLTFLVMLTYVLTLRGLADATVGQGQPLVDDFRTVVLTVVGFYFGSEAVVSAAKVLASSKPGANATDIRRADRDLAPAPARASAWGHGPAGRTPLTK
jgi:hypothetical protein